MNGHVLPPESDLNGKWAKLQNLGNAQPRGTVEVSPSLAAFQFARMFPEYPILQPSGNK